MVVYGRNIISTTTLTTETVLFGYQQNKVKYVHFYYIVFMQGGFGSIGISYKIQRGK